MKYEFKTQVISMSTPSVKGEGFVDIKLKCTNIDDFHSNLNGDVLVSRGPRLSSLEISVPFPEVHKIRILEDVRISLEFCEKENS